MSQIGQYSQSSSLASGDKFITENAAGNANSYFTFGGLSGQIFSSTSGSLQNSFYSNSNPQQYTTSGNLTQTGVSLANTILGASGVLNSQIQNTGSYLFGLINASSAGVGSINSASGNLSLTGAGNVSVIVNGQTFTISGNTGVYSNFATTTNLASTGSTLYSLISNASGQYNSNFATQIQLAQTGSNLYSIINGLSGQSNINFATIITTNAISGNLISTGISLISVIQSTGQAAWSVANSNAINLSGQLTQTGISIYASINALSGYINNISGAIQAQINTINAYPRNYIGSGNPEGVLSAISGSLYTDWFNRGFYQKITGSSVNGWI